MSKDDQLDRSDFIIGVVLCLILTVVSAMWAKDRVVEKAKEVNR
jgi:hypothetical protein